VLAEFFHSMIDRGLRTPTSVTADGAKGLRNAIDAVFANSLRIRCWFHKMATIHSKLPDDDAEEVLAHVRAIRDAATIKDAFERARSFAEGFGREFPAGGVPARRPRRIARAPAVAGQASPR